MVGPEVVLATEVSHLPTPPSADNGTSATVVLAGTVKGGIAVGHVTRQVRWASSTRPLHMGEGVLTKAQHHQSSRSSVGSDADASSLSSFAGGVSWEPEDYIKAHLAIKESGKYNYEGCRIPIPTNIRYDRLRASLGNEITQ